MLNHTPLPHQGLFRNYDRINKPLLLRYAKDHGLSLHGVVSADHVRDLLIEHISKGECHSTDSSACRCVVSLFPNAPSMLDFQVCLLSEIVVGIKLAPLRRLLRCQGVAFEPSLSLGQARRKLRNHIRLLRKGKQKAGCVHDIRPDDVVHNLALKNIQDQWPTLVSPSLKDKLISMFREATSSESLAEFTCACCAESCFVKNRRLILASSLNLDLLHCPVEWSDDVLMSPPLPYNEGPLANVLVDRAGVSVSAEGEIMLATCTCCARLLQKNKLPPLALANRTYLGPIPDELKDLTPVEESMIARCRAKCWIVQLKEDNQDLSLPTTQRGMRGHIIIYPQQPDRLLSVLPPSIDDIIMPICVIFIGHSPPTAQWLQDKAKPLAVRRERVRSALLWLKEHNPHYKEVVIDHGVLNSLAPEQILPFHIQHVLQNDAQDSLTAGYDPSASLASNVASSSLHPHLPFQNVVITDVDGNASANELRASAVRHMKKKGGAYIEIPHAPQPVNEFCNPALFPKMYPTLFPYGVGGFEDCRRKAALSLKRQVRHLFNLADHRFQQHFSFLFTTFNILQRRAVLLHTSLKVNKSSFNSIASTLSNVSFDAVHRITERVSRGDFATSHDAEEDRVLHLMREVKVIASHVPGSSAARLTMRNEIRALMTDLGLPSFYITINPADVYNPVVKFLAGADIDVDRLLPEQVPNYWEQAILVAKNPALAAKFFNLYMKAFISTLLGFDPNHQKLTGGVLGLVNGYYGCVEAQGRGTLHCHMMVWVEGGLNPNEIRDRVLKNDHDFQCRLLAFLDDTISNLIPVDPDPLLVVPSTSHHPCSVRGIDLSTTEPMRSVTAQKDLHHLVKQCQLHTHTQTCYKYWKGPGYPKECRFGLHEGNIRVESTFDEASGDLSLRCLDGLVNNFNATILQAIRCNMDIKFMGSGTAAKAVLYYITDYISKSQLKTHVAFAALELAVKKLGERETSEDDHSARAKALLQKCAFSMLSHQELSAQQVCSYLMDFEDHFTSHCFRNLYWRSFESFVEQLQPSPECGTTTHANTDLSNEMCEFVEGMEDDQLEEDDERPHQDGLASDEIAVGVDNLGNLVPRSSQVSGYVLRGTMLTPMSLWDFVSRVDKVYKSKIREKNSDLAESDDEDLDTADDDGDSNHDPPVTNLDDLLSSTDRLRPRCDFLPEYLDSSTHFLRIRKPLRRLVPVPIGPSLPRRDQVQQRARYCRLMLLFFKPWRTIHDLREVGQSWENAFQDFTVVCPQRFHKIMDNMQILHECKDSRDDHFALRQAATGKVNSEMATSDSYQGMHVDDGMDESDILEHLQSISACRPLKKAYSDCEVAECLLHAEASGMYATGTTDNHDAPNNSDTHELVGDLSLDMEAIWQTEYQRRREAWKSNMAYRGRESNPLPSTSLLAENPTIQNNDACRHEIPSLLPSIRQDVVSDDLDREVDIDRFIVECTLNTEQARAFRIIAQHSLQTRPEPLRMYLGGAGGTGKSRVIQALNAFFTRRNQARRFRLASYTGVAARNILGMTLHAVLCLGRHSKLSAKTKRNLTAMWEGVDYFFIDEVSMMGCKFLADISEALSVAKGNSSAFGGINIIFAGDFAQLPPVGQKCLFSRLDTRSMAQGGTKSGQKAILGKLLWLSVRTVVILTEIMRQSGPENQAFVDLLSRLREGRCTLSDHALLSTRVIRDCHAIDFTHVRWREAPMIVSSNAVKDALNVRAAISFAQHTGCAIHWYHATDQRGGTVLSDPDLLSALNDLHSGETNQQLGKIPLVIGMPVMIGHNFDVQGGVVNGTRGFLRRIRYAVDDLGRRHLKSCIVHVPDLDIEPLADLPARHVPVLEDTTDIFFSHPHSQKKCVIKRTQVPITPAFAMTTHKAQGQSLTTVVVDLQSCKGTEAPYMMISRATSLDGLAILRPFTPSTIASHQSQETRMEMQRLEVLRLKTITSVGTDAEVSWARNALQTLSLSVWEPETVSTDQPNLQLQRLQDCG